MTIPSGRRSAERASERACFLTHLMLGGSLIQQPSSEQGPHRREIYRFHLVELWGKRFFFIGGGGVPDGVSEHFPSPRRRSWLHM